MRLAGSRSWWILTALLAGLLAFELVQGLCVQEDAFISFRYARNLVDGHGLVYNPGERVEGYTNFLWTLYLAGGMALGLDPVPLARFSGMLASLLLVLLVWRLAARRDAQRRVTGGVLAAALVAATPGVAGEAVQGLETLLFALLVAAGVGLGLEARRREAAGARGAPGRHLLSGLVLALAALTRPEGVGVLGLLLLGGAIWRLRRGRGPVSRGELAAVLVFLAVYVPYWLWRFDYYGYPFPNTFYAKTGGGLWHALRGLRYVGRFLLLHPVIALLSAWALAAGLRRRCGEEPGGRGDDPLPVAGLTVVAGYLLYVVVVGGDFKQTARFVLPVLPIWALLIDDAVSRRGWPLWRRVDSAPLAEPSPAETPPAQTPPAETPPADSPQADSLPAAGRRRAAGVAASLVLGAVLLNGLAAAPSVGRWARRRAWDMERRTACGRYLAENARPGAVLAIHSAGIIPYYSGLRTIDMWGLNDLHIGHRAMEDMGRSRPPGHEKVDPAYVFSRRPDYYVDEFYYVVGEPIRDLKQRHFPQHAAARRVADLYRVRNVPLLLDDGSGPATYWFNFLELARPAQGARRPAGGR